MKKKTDNSGFTLVELVAVVAILLALATIAVVTVTGVLRDTNKDTKKVEESQILDAAKRYVNDNIDNYECGTSGYNINVSTLIDDGYLEDTDGELKNSGLLVIVDFNTNCKPTYEID